LHGGVEHRARTQSVPVTQSYEGCKDLVQDAKIGFDVATEVVGVPPDVHHPTVPRRLFQRGDDPACAQPLA